CLIIIRIIFSKFVGYCLFGIKSFITNHMMKFTYFGHACFHIELNGFKFLFDPFITPVGNDKIVDIDSIQADYILVSHGHEDHVADLKLLAEKTQATVISNPEILAWLDAPGY